MSDDLEPIEALTFKLKCACGGCVGLINSWQPTPFESYALVQCLSCKKGWRVGPSMIQVSIDSRQSERQAIFRWKKECAAK